MDLAGELGMASTVMFVSSIFRSIEKPSPPLSGRREEHVGPISRIELTRIKAVHAHTLPIVLLSSLSFSSVQGGS